MASRKEDQIIQAALEVFRSRGIKKSTIEEIAAAAAVSKVTLYKYYKNKDELLLGILEKEGEVILQKFRSVLAAGKPFPEKFREINNIGEKLMHKFASDLQLDMANDLYLIADGLEKFNEKHTYPFIRELIEQGKKQKAIRDEVNADAFVFIAKSLRYAVYNGFIKDNSQLHQMGYYIKDIIWNGMFIDKTGIEGE